MAKVPRYAIYYTPAPDHLLTRTAAAWLGRDAFVPGHRATMDDAVATMTSEPRRYGFHATLKAPFRLADGHSVGDLETAVAAFAASAQPCAIGPLQIATLKGFVALRPVRQPDELPRFVSDIVRALDHFRAPLNEAEVKRRLKVRLDETEDYYLRRWGYPYVFDRFRFHMTLTNVLTPDQCDGVSAEMATRFAACLDENYSIDALTLFEQQAPGGDFMAKARFPIGQAQ